MQGCLNLSYIT